MQKYLDLLKTFLAFKSISTDPKYRVECQGCATWLKDLFEPNGLKTELWQDPAINPVVYAQYDAGKAETILIYGHYDVQPAVKENGWASDPFELVQKDERLYGRGVVDNKGQVLIHIFSVIELIKQDKLEKNVVFLIEGNEETGNTALGKLIEKNKNKLKKVSTILVSDGVLASDKPTIETSLRGGYNAKLTLRTAKTNVHSGLFGGAIPNAAHEISLLIGKLHTQDNQVSFPEFYEGVDEISAKERKHCEALDAHTQALLDQIEVKTLKTEKIETEVNSFPLQTGLRPCLEVTGIQTGYTGEGFANIVPAAAEARFNVRLASSQDPEKNFDRLRNFIADNLPDYVGWKLEINGPHEPIKVHLDTPKAKAAQTLLKQVYKDQVMFKYVGGAIPIVVDFKKILGIDTLLIPLANNDCNMHGINENFKVDLVKKGLEFSSQFFSS